MLTHYEFKNQYSAGIHVRKTSDEYRSSQGKTRLMRACRRGLPQNVTGRRHSFLIVATNYLFI